MITCAEYNADQMSNLSIIKKKPGCRLAAGIKLKLRTPRRDRWYC